MKMQKERRLNKAMIAVIFALAWPTMLEQLMQTAVQYIDTAMVGSLGTQATAAVGATSTVGWLIGSTISATSIGFLSFIARACGAGDREGARRSVSQAVLATLVLGVIFTILPLALSGLVPAISSLYICPCCPVLPVLFSVPYCVLPAIPKRP